MKWRFCECTVWCYGYIPRPAHHGTFEDVLVLLVELAKGVGGKSFGTSSLCDLGLTSLQWSPVKSKELAIWVEQDAKITHVT